MPDKKDCPICSNVSYLRLKKDIVDYYQCTNCLTLFSEALDNSDMVGGGNEIPRNVEQNHLRIGRIDELVYSLPKHEVNILDFGCGTGMLIEDLKKHGYVNVDGYDAYNTGFSKLPERDKYHVISAIEVIEHTSAPYVEIDVMYRSLRKGGVVMLETSFVDIAKEEGIALEDFFYIEPKVGHSTIFSNHGLDLLFVSKGFKVVQHFNRNVKLYQKIIK